MAAETEDNRPRFILVNLYGPLAFLWSDKWIADRNAAEPLTLEEAHLRKKLHAKDFPGGGNMIVIDEYDHPELEEAILACMCGDRSELSTLQRYEEKCGMASLEHFARRVMRNGLSSLMERWGCRPNVSKAAS